MLKEESNPAELNHVPIVKNKLGLNGAITIIMLIHVKGKLRNQKEGMKTMNEIELIIEIILYLVMIGLILFMWKKLSDAGLALPY